MGGNPAFHSLSLLGPADGRGAGRAPGKRGHGGLQKGGICPPLRHGLHGGGFGALRAAAGLHCLRRGAGGDAVPHSPGGALCAGGLLPAGGCPVRPLH